MRAAIGAWNFATMSAPMMPLRISAVAARDTLKTAPSVLAMRSTIAPAAAGVRLPVGLKKSAGSLDDLSAGRTGAVMAVSGLRGPLACTEAGGGAMTF